MFVHGPIPFERQGEGSTSEEEEELDSATVLKKRREECERKARRGEMDPRLEYTFQLLIDATGLPRSEIMDNVFEGNMLDQINEIFLPHMRDKLIWFYQEVEEQVSAPNIDHGKGVLRGIQNNVKSQVQSTVSYKKKLFLTDGWSCPLTGICIYMFRLNTVKQLPEEGFQKDLFCGVINARKVGLVTTVQRVMEHVFMEVLAQPSVDAEDDEVAGSIIRDQLLPGLRSFCSALKVCEEVCKTKNIFDDGKTLMENVKTYEEVKEYISEPRNKEILEERVKIWIKKINDVILESEQLRQENDSSGPQDELEYWKKRDAQLSQINVLFEDHEVKTTIHCLTTLKSKIIKQWKEIRQGVIYCFNEARDNAKYIQSIEKSCHALYLHDPVMSLVRMQSSILRLLQTVKLIHSVSQYYNTSERTSALMVKITNQMIRACKQYITCHGKETVWSQDQKMVREKLEHCVQLNQVYHKAYLQVKEQSLLPDQPSLQFSENYVFGKFDTFCKRLGKIITMFNLVESYNALFESKMEELEAVVKNFDEMKAAITSKIYDYLDQRNTEFDSDFDEFIKNTTTLKESIAQTIEDNYKGIWETTHGVKFLNRFAKVSKKIPLKQMSDKYLRIIKYCDKEVDKVLKVFKKQKQNPPVPKTFPPLAGRISWSRSLLNNLKEEVESVSTHPLLKSLPETSELKKKFTYVSISLNDYENHILQIWMNHNVWSAEKCLKKKLLVLDEKSGGIKINFDFKIKLMIREAECMRQMDLPSPAMTLILLSKSEHFSKLQNLLKDLLREFLATVKKVKLEVRPLFLPQLVRLSAMLSPAFTTLDWTNPGWKDFLNKVYDAIKSFDILITRVHDVYENRILHVLASIQSITLHILPDENPWTIDEFIEKTEENCRNVATELNRKSLMVEEAVEEILDLVKKAAEQFKAKEPNEEVELMIEGGSNGPNDSSTESNQQQDWSIVSECFEHPQTLLHTAGGGLSRAMQDLVRNAVSEMRRYYSRKVADVLIKITRQAIDTIRKRFIIQEGNKPILLISAILSIPDVIVTPSIEEVQECLITVGKEITNVARGVSQWTGGKQLPKGMGWRKLGIYGNRTGPKTLANFVSRLDQTEPTKEDPKTRRRRLYRLDSNNKPPFPFQARNFHSYVMENKEIIKTLSLLSLSTQPIKEELQLYLQQWKPYKILWASDSISTKRDIHNVKLLDCEQALSLHVDLDNYLTAAPNVHIIGNSVAINIDKLKVLLSGEIKQSTHKIGQILRKKYQREMDYVYAVMSEMERKLDRPIRDLDDVRMVMETLKKIRDQEVDMELSIEPIEEAFNILTRYELPVDKEILEKVDNLRYTWQQLLSRAMGVNTLLLEMQPAFQEELQNNLEKFRLDSEEYCLQYRNSGPMSPGLSPREASDRLIMFQNRFDGMWRKLQAYQNGEELFGLPNTDYPELGQIRKELNLLQKLYKLYNDVIDRVSSYYDIPWGEVNIEDINNELMEFQNRCRKLPKGLKEWPAFHALKRTIDDFNDMCPLLELMANRAMKPRHWQRIMEVTKHTFDLDSDDFCLKHILAAPLLKYKEDIEDICISAMKEKDIEAKLRQVTNEWSIHELTFMTFNNRGELLLRGDTTAETIGQLEDSLMVLGSLLSNRYNAPFRKQIQQWVTDLGNTNEILERWLLVQNLWVYLEAVFVGGDIAKQLPKEAKRFSKIDKSWQKIMQRAHETPGVVSCCVGDDMLKQLLPHLQEQLELCQKSLSGKSVYSDPEEILRLMRELSDESSEELFDDSEDVDFENSLIEKVDHISDSEQFLKEDGDEEASESTDLQFHIAKDGETLWLDHAATIPEKEEEEEEEKYLEKKRMMFPRFFFVSDPALLEILGQASDSHTIQNHLLSIFDNTRYVKFHDIEYNKMTAIVSSEGECIQLERTVRAEGSVETWLTALLQSSQASLHGIIRNAYTMINDTNFNILTFLDKNPAQVGLLGIQMIWTRDSEIALSQARSDKKIMAEMNNKFLELLNTLIDQTTRDLTKLERIKFETLITIHVHQRDIFDTLVRMNVKSVNDFEWLKQCRFYFKEDLDKTWISITDVVFIYQNEYLGCTDRLVITPLTDRCYITLAQALAMSMGGAPCGPAGTGKTETVKDMGKTLGKYVVVFNCSDQMDYKGLGRIYKGLAQSGTWGCFDEFNRIELPVLSVAAQQVAVVLNAKKEKKRQFYFTDGDLVDMCPEFGIFITMNPGYAGRKELPENLKLQFRTVAMMVPDRQIIIRVKLASCGFLENITLARKFYTLYKLCEEQLTKQVHYDFGLRNILSVLRSLGAAKRVNFKDTESTIVMRVLRDMNLSKLIDEDEPLFISLVADLFPNQSLEKTTYPELEAAVMEHVEETGLVYHPPWVLKIIQLYETQRVRHGIMTLGPEGAGKTTCIHTLMAALTKCGDYHREMRMNPKAITAAQMFGRLDVATNDWTDGIFSALWRKTLKLKKGEYVWLVLDGPVDSIWIENLNSVLDDNKTLTLANGDRLGMAATCKIIFEPHNIDNASPATVSRNGMVYMSSSGLDWQPVIEAWLKTRSAIEQIVFRVLFDNSFLASYTYATQNLKFSMKVLQCNIIQQMVILMQSLVPVEQKVVKGEDKEESEETAELSIPTLNLTEDLLGRIYLFSLVWSFGAFFDIEDRIKFNKFLQGKMKNLSLPVPLEDEDGSVFNYGINEDGNWQSWNKLVPAYNYPDQSTPDFNTILVPIIESVCIDYLINCIARQNKPVLLIGEQGSAKTIMMKTFMKKLDTDKYLIRSFNFSSATSPYQFQKTIESFVEKRMGNLFGPAGGKKMVVFIDDINLPEINEWGDQITNEIVRQAMDMNGFYSLEKPGEFVQIVDVHFVAAMGQPGGGRNDIPSRLKRQFCIFNCTFPSDASVDKIFRIVGEGHYNLKRGFSQEVRLLIKKLVPLTRKLWHKTRSHLLPTPAKFHYVFSLRDLSRIWQGMVGTLSNVIESESILLLLWKNESTRVFADRFTSYSDKEWFDNLLIDLVGTELGENFKAMSLPNPPFVDFMRDAPEPTGEEGEEADMELPKVYEPVWDIKELQDRLDMFLSQFNEMVRGSGMDLVFFPDAMLHLVKISRVIRHPRGNIMLIGVGGSGKQSLTKLASFIAGYKTFQIALTRSYNVANFLEDIKFLYRTCGAQGKGTTFIFTDLDIKEEIFLEYLNNILSSGVISNLFTRDEQSEIMSELSPTMRRENPKRTLTTEIVMEYFIQRTVQNLHVAFCFSPVGEKFRYRAMRFPALVSGCTLNWFQPWPRDALVSVASHFLVDFSIDCTAEIKNELVDALGYIQDIVSTTSSEYFQRFRRSTHVTPKSYLNFISSYKKIYVEKQKELGEGALRMDTGLAKLDEASECVAVLKTELADMEMELAVASKKAEDVLLEVTERANQAEEVKNQVMVVKEKAEILVQTIAKEKKTAERKLEAAKPALEEAEAALNTIKPAHIATVRKLGRPPHLIMRIMDCVLILFQRKLHPVIPDNGAPCPKPSWAESLKMMASTTFLLQLQNYPKDNITNEMIDLLQPYFEMEDYNMDTAQRVCGDVAGLLSWTKAMSFFHSVNKEVLPLKANLKLQEARLKSAMDDLAAAEEELAARERSLEDVKAQYNAAVSEKQRLTDAANNCLRKMTAATALINGLGGEKIRWTRQSKEFKEQLGRLVGDVLLATAFLSYCGPYNQQFRSHLIAKWMDILVKRKIPVTKNLHIINMLVESATISEWTLQGLPNDELSVQNALIVTKSSSYPLLIDPQTQAKMWIKNKEANNELQITSLNHKYFRTHLEDCLSLGRPLLIEDVGEELDPVIDNVLEKNFIKSGSIEKVVVGDKETDVMPGFMLYITTKLPNPAYSPEISAKTSIIDFTVTMQGLEDQLLGRVILMEKSELEAERVTLFESVIKNQRSMKELESNLLHRLTSSEGSLVDDEALIDVLQETKTTSEDVNAKLIVSADTEKKIMKAREEFRAVAARGSILYFLIVEMSNVNIMYQNSLKQFLTIFDNSITKSEKCRDTEERIQIILSYLTYQVWIYTLRGLYERHKALFTLMLAMKIDCYKGMITHDEFLAFIKGGASLDLNAVTPKPYKWILDITWLNLVEISKLPVFENVLQKIKGSEREWRIWYEKEKPEEADLPCGYQKSLDVFRKLLLIRSWSPDRTISQARKYIVGSLGPEYGEASILDLEVTWGESEPRTPLICILSIGSDPSPQITLLAKSQDIALRSVSMGQGQEYTARQMISDGMANGGWVLLQNIHLSLPFCTEVMDALADADMIDETFRLWMTTEVHTEFPIGLLQMAIKFTNEPPQGIRASMKRTYQNITQDTLDYSAQAQWPPLLYAVAFLHTILQERRKFGPLGWNVAYEFNQADFAASVQFIQNHLDDMDPKKGISWATVCYMLGEVQYGGRVTDDFDKRLLTTFTQVWFCDVLLRPGFEFYHGYKVPITRNIQGYTDYINSLPVTDSPEVFGLHPNADITYQINTANGILDTILNVQPKEGGSQGGETREAAVYKLAEDMLRKLPKQYNSFEVRDALQRMGALLPMNIFLRQEIDRLQKVIRAVQTTLVNVKLAIDGTIVMSHSLRMSLDAMYDARIPESWQKLSWESATLGFWYTELLEREVQFKKWLQHGRPVVFWMTGFFNPQGFLTAMRQEVTRAHKGWALDSVVLQNLITRHNKEDIHEAPPEGVYVHGLFLEGAGLDRRSGKLVESKPKVLYEQMPVIYIYAINTTAGKDPKLYECPIYRKPQRTDQKYVGSIDFETDNNPRHWTLRGVALLCDIK